MALREHLGCLHESGPELRHVVLILRHGTLTASHILILLQQHHELLELGQWVTHVTSTAHIHGHL